MMLRIGVLKALLGLVIVSAHVAAEVHNGLYQRHEAEPIFDFASGPLARPVSLSFHYHRDLMVSPSGANSTLSDNSTLAVALRTVRGAQAEMRELRARLMANPRKSDFRPAPDAIGAYDAGGQRIQPNGTLASTDSTSDATGINGTVASAAKLVAEAVAWNSSLAAYLEPGNSSLTPEGANAKRAGGYWMEGMTQNGVAPYAGAGYKVWRNVKDYGAKGDGVSDDTAAINQAITDGNRCGSACGSTTATPAVVYFPAGTYLVSGTLLAYYYTQMIGDATNPPILKAAASFSGFGVVSSNAYVQGDVTWYINQGNFYRQVRNFIIDIRDAPLHDQVCGLHWQVGQGTSLENIQFIMSEEAGNNQMGIFMENGSGGFMSDLTFTGGAQGALFGNQQFTARNLKFSNHQKQAMQLLWDWGWTWKGITIENCPVGVYMFTGTDGPEEAALFVDSVFTNVNIGLKLEANLNGGAASLNLFNVVANNVPVMVAYDNGQTLLGGVSGTIVAWGVGKRYDSTNGEDSGVWQAGQYYSRTPVISSSLMGGSGIFARSKPQYTELGAGDFLNVKSTYGAKGDGASDDTAALNKAFQASASSGQVAWLPYGVYIVTDTVFIPPGAKVVGQLWSNIMASGVKFSDASKPYPVVKVGNVGDVGTVEIQDVLFTVRGGTAGAKLVEWNIMESSQGAAAMWDSHVRVGGAVGSNLQTGDCPKLSGGVKPECVSASMLMHITSKASGYFENAWLWVGDHDLETTSGTQIDVFAGRGLLIEGPGPVWLWGTAVEHCVLYQYQLAEASNVFMGMIQTESPYYQPTPNAPQPFTNTDLFPHDPAWGYCDPSWPSCAVSWALRIINSAHVFIYGAGLYSWFQSYDASCIDKHVCQDRIAEIATSSDIWVFNLATKDSVEMISPDGGTSVLGAANHYNYLDVIMAWLGGAGGGPIGGPGGPGSGDSGNGTTGGGGGGGGGNGGGNNGGVGGGGNGGVGGGNGVGGGATYKSPTNATVIPFPKTTVKPTNTFTVAGPVVSDIDGTGNDGNENTPQGPGADICTTCDLFRLITSTCCGTGGSVENPITIGAGTPLPRPMILPPGFVPNQPITGDDGNTYPAGQPLPQPVTVPVGTIFPVPFVVPGGIPLSAPPEYGWPGVGNGDDDDNDGNGTLYMTGDFWGGPPEVYCFFPCVILFPPVTTTTTWTPPVITFSTSGTTTTVTPTPETTQKIRVPKVTVTSPPGSDPTKKVQPVPAQKPLCITLHILFVTIKICPPPIPKIHLPPLPLVTIKPLPPGGKPGPTEKDNKPTDDEKEEEEEEDEDDEDETETCPAVFIDDDPDDTDVAHTDYPGEGADNTPPGYTPPAAGTGTASTTTVSVTVTMTPPTSQPTATPTLGGTTACYDQSTPQSTALWHSHMFEFCHDFDGQVVEADVDADPSESWLAFWYRWYDGDDWWTWIQVNANPGCAFEITESRCGAIMQGMIDKCGAHAGQYRDNCALWNAVPGSRAHGDVPGAVNGHRNPDALLNPPKGTTTIGKGPDYPTSKPPVTVTVTPTPTSPPTPPPTTTPPTPTPSRVYNVWSFTYQYGVGGGNTAIIYRVQGYDKLVGETCYRSDSEWDYTQVNVGTDFYLRLDNMEVFGNTCDYKASVTSYNGLSRGTKIGALTCDTGPGATCYRGAGESRECDHGTEAEEMYCVMD